MKEVLKAPQPSVEEWQYVIIGCHMCDALWRFSSKKEAEDTITMWGMGVFAYVFECPRCKTKLALSTPLHGYQTKMFRRLYELEQKALVFDTLELPEALRAEDV